ncbi:MAG: four helix bundle protein [Leptolyngbyaceae cyanobacterium]
MPANFHSFQDLHVYQWAFKSSVDVYEQVQQFPADSDVRVARQLLATSRAVRAHIAAAWGKRRDREALLSKLSDAHFEATEMQIWIGSAIAAGYLDGEPGQDLCDRYHCIEAALDQLMESASNRVTRLAASDDDVLPATA